MDQSVPIIAVEPPKTNWVLLLLAGMIILVIGIGIGLMLGKYSPKQISSYEDCMKAKGSSVQESNPPTCVTANGLRFKGPVASPTLTPDPTANWKTYSNTSYGLSLLFPKEWEPCITQGTASFLLAPGKCNPPYAEYYLAITVLKDTQEVPVYMGPGDANAYTSTGKQTITLGSNKFIKQKFIQTKPYEWNAKQYPVGPVVIFYDLVDSNKNRVIEFYKSPSSKTDEATVEQILSTFKFVDPDKIFCGGIMGAECPSGSTCKLDGNYPDASGVCVKN